MATPPALRTKNDGYFPTVGSTKSVTIPGTTVVGDLMLLQWVGGTALDSPPPGWSPVQEITDGPQHVVWQRVAQAGDAGSTITVPATSTAKSFLRVLVYAGASSASPIAGSNAAPEASTASVHSTPTVASMPADAKVVQFYAAKDGATSSSARSIASGHTLLGNLDSAAATFGFVSMAAERDAATTAGTVASVLWTTDQPTATASMITVVLAPATSTVGVRPVADTLVPAGTTFDGGTTIAGVTSDSDPNTRAKIGLTGTAAVAEVRMAPLAAPLNKLEVDVQCSPGTATLSMVVSLYNGTTLIRSYPAFTTVNTAGVATFSQAVSSADQAAQTSLSDIRVRLSLTGS
ncbi:hypothetical protein [Phycicoccus jejuensis]|uniref:hypothetical protein n=1 Tax=Phycicoccus jejuensis TaxID=367299 RepID=UPI0004C386C3|nr:hypothetical protein [Phycicoccus jejuensis]